MAWHGTGRAFGKAKGLRATLDVIPTSPAHAAMHPLIRLQLEASYHYVMPASHRPNCLACQWIACLALTAAGLLSGCVQVPRHEAAASRAGTLSYALAGPPTTPVVVLQSGLGDGIDRWAPVWDLLTPRHRVFAPDRPGYGRSPATSEPRDACHMAAELRSALREANVPPPYLLVGHSLGGLYQYVFARMYPDETAGLVLLDPTHPAHLATLQRETPEAAAAVRLLRSTVFTATMRAEFDDQGACLDRITHEPLKGIPTRLLVSTRFGPLEGEAFQRAIARLRSDWQRLLGAPAVEAVPSSGHYIHHDAPARVQQAIDDIASGDPMWRR